MVTIADFKRFVDGLQKPVTTKIGYVDARIKALLPSDSDEIILYRDFQRLGKGLQREQLLDGVDNQRYIDVVEIIHNHLGWNQNAIKDFGDACWQDVIAACSEEMPLQRMDWLEEYDKEHRRAAAAIELREFGVKIKIENCDYVTENDDIVYDALTKWVRECGGRRFLNLLLSQLEYLEPEGRFLTDMNGNMPNPKDVTIVKPYNYLVNLALANINADGGSYSEAAKAFGNAIKLATNYCFLKYPVQNFGNVWEDLFHRDRDTVEFSRDLVYKESIFGLTQHSVWFTRMFCERVLKYMRDSGRVLANGYTFDEYEHLMNYVLSAADTLKCVELRKDQLNELGIKTIDQLVDDVATGDDVLNNGFRTPLDEEKENAADKPLIKTNGKIYAMPATIGSWGWFEALLTVVRNQEKDDKQKDIDKEVGKLIEDYINEKLDEKGITHCCGDYIPPAEGEAPLYTKIRRNGMQMYICTGIRVDIQEWNKSQKSLSAMQRYEKTEEGTKVHDLQMKVIKAIDMLYAENKIKAKEDKSVIEQTLSAIVNGTTEEIQQTAKVATAKSRSTVLGFYDYFYAGISDGSIRHGNNSDYSPGTVVVWKAFGENLRGYCKKDIPFDEIDKPFADKFTLYLMKQGYMPNTINKKVSCFRKLCNLAAMEGYNKNAVSLRVWKDRAVKEIEKRTEIYLTDEEINAMYDMQLSGENEIVRDIFVLGYFSCQRYSDYCKLREENFITYNKSGLITLTQKKTGKKVEVPIFDDRVYELCEKYHYDFPNMDVQKMNLKIKAVGAELAKTVPSFSEKYVTVLTTAEKRAEKTYEKLLAKKNKGIKFTENERKWFHKLDKLAKIRNGSPLWERNKYGEIVRAKYELICSHTARRSGTTNLYKLGVLSDLELRSITGHESQKNFEGYIRIGISEQAQRVGDKIKAAMEAKRQVDK